MRTLSLLRSFTCIASSLSAVRAFSVTVGTPSQCDDLTVSWTGGQAPFEILLTPIFNVPNNISVPASAFTNGKGSYSISQLPFSSGTQFVLTMSDATSFGSGGTTTILTVGDPVAKNNCNTTGRVDFTFDLPSALQQCSGYAFDAYDGAVQPITITALIPGGESLVLHPPIGSSYTWVADVRAGTNLIFVMTDSQGRQGGSSDLVTVALSNDASCLNASSPSSTVSLQLSTTSGLTSTSSVASPTSSQSASSGSNVGTIVGTAIGCMVALAAFVTLGIFLLRQRRASRSPYTMSSSKRHSRRLPSVDLDHGASRHGHIPTIYPFPYHVDSSSHITPPGTQSRQTSTPTGNYAVSDRPRSFNHTRQGSNNDSSVGNREGESSLTTSVGSRKAAMAGQSTYKSATRFILHTDVDDVLSDEGGVVELPPQYSESRQPLALRPEPAQRPMSSYSEYSGPNELAYAGSAFVSSPSQSQSQPPPDT